MPSTSDSSPAAGSVLLLHGFPQGPACWTAVEQRLRRHPAARLRTLAPAQRGYTPDTRGLPVAAYRLEHLVADALRALEQLEPTGSPVHVVGHDWGAAVAWALAAEHPDRVRTLTALSVPHPAAYAAALRRDPRQQARSAYQGFFQLRGVAERLLLAGDARPLRAFLTGSGCPPAVAASYVRAMQQPGALPAALGWYRANGPSVLAAVPPVTVPTTFLWSGRDASVGRATARRCAEHVAADLRYVELPRASHWLPETEPAAVARAVLSRVSTPRV
jgi:pimeloyl-ACP methyl ester carboxylesterase